MFDLSRNEDGCVNHTDNHCYFSRSISRTLEHFVEVMFNVVDKEGS